MLGVNNNMNMSSMNNTFSLDDVADLVEKPMPAPQAQANPNYNQQMLEQQYQQQYQQQPQQMVNENYQQFTGLNEQQIRSIVKDEMINYFSGELTKKIRESAIKSTIQTLIKEGKMSVKKKSA